MRAVAITDKEKHGFEEIHTKSSEICRRQTSTRPPMMIDVSPKQPLNGGNLFHLQEIATTTPY
jgi:hypothetical protein